MNSLYEHKQYQFTTGHYKALLKHERFIFFTCQSGKLSPDLRLDCLAKFSLRGVEGAGDLVVVVGLDHLEDEGRGLPTEPVNDTAENLGQIELSVELGEMSEFRLIGREGMGGYDVLASLVSDSVCSFGVSALGTAL